MHFIAKLLTLYDVLYIIILFIADVCEDIDTDI